jgi:hypothetical protein
MGDPVSCSLLELKSVPIPDPFSQITFLVKVQRLLSDGQFTATYKFALLQALADVAVLTGEDTDAILEITADQIADRFIRMYWRQARPYGATTAPILLQNIGQQAAIIRMIAAAQAQVGGSLAACARTPETWNTLLHSVSTVVRDMPLWKLQRIGSAVDDFLYPQVGRGGVIQLRPGVAFCLRKYHGILRNLIEGAWLDFIRRQNLVVLGQSADLGAFLFGAERSSLDAFRPLLVSIQRRRCLYCKREIRDAGEVDHFIPWTRYPADLGHNLVLAHKSCNHAKSDHLASILHLETWVTRNADHHQELEDFCLTNRLPSSSTISTGIARWAYAQAAATEGLVWLEDDRLEPLGADWARVFPAA